MTIFFVTTQEAGISYVPNYTILICHEENVRRAYVGQLAAADDTTQPPETFSNIIEKYYNEDLGIMLMNMTSGGYEVRDIDILEDIGLIYDSFRFDIKMGEHKFFKIRNSRWRSVDQIIPYTELCSFIERNDRLVRIVVNKIAPRIKGGIWDGSRSDRLLEDAIDPVTVARAMYHPDAPEDCDICSIPLAKETFFSDGRLQGGPAWANMCADCTIFFGDGIGWGTGQLYRKERDGRWLMVGGSSHQEDNESD